MPNPIRVLIVEDSPDDAELEVLHLRQAGYDPAWTRVETVASFNAAIQDGYEIILADYQLPGFTGLDAMRLLKQSGRDIPLILVSGTVGEEVAVESIKLGVADYLIKDRLARLGPAVQQALAAAAARRAQREAEAALHAGEANYRALFEQASDGIFLAEATGRYLDANRAGLRMVGYTRDELLQLTLRDLILPENLAAVPLQLAQMNAGQAVSQLRQMRRKDGSWFWAEISGAQLADGRLQGIVRDVSKRIEMEEALRAGEARYRAIVNLPIAQISRWQPDFTLTFANEAYAAARGSRPEAVIGRRWPDLLPPFERSGALEIARDLVANPRISTAEHVGLFPDGSQHTIIWTDYPIFDAEGRLLEYQSFGQDTTELRSIEQRMHLLARAADQSPASIIITDPHGVIEYVNRCTVELTGYDADELIGRTPALLKSGNTPPAVYRDLWGTILSGQEWQGELQNRKKSGELYWEAQRISPILDIHGNLTHFLAVREDVTDRRATEATLRQLNEQLEQRVEERTTELRAVNAALQRAALAKDEFLASMSHELRTPLAGILGIVEGLQEHIYGTLNDRQLHALGALRQSGEHLLGLINDILDVAKAEAGQLRPQLDTFPVADVCQASVSLVRGLAQRKHQRIALAIDPPGMLVQADGRRLKQILVNLLSNAVKFTPEDGLIGLEVAGDAAAQAIRFAVWDTGIGIAAQDLPKLFQPFTQLDSSLAREYAGTGLGLALVRNLAELHNGSVEVTSTPGYGSRFTVILPWMHPATEAAPGDEHPVLTPDLAVAHPAGSQPLVLVADDNPVMVEVYCAYLQAAGCRTLVANRGSEAVTLAEREHPAIILMDIQMPGMDGFAAIRRLRASADPAVAAIPIVALTALAMPGDRERCLDAGATDYLSKPVPLAALVSTINRLLAVG